MTNFNERTNTLLYKNIISHSLFSKGWCLLCVRDELETGTDCYIDPSSSDHSSTFFASSCLWLLNRGSLGAQSPLSAAGSHFGILSPTNSNRLCTWLYYCLTCFRCLSAYLHRCISWLTARSRVNIYICIYIYIYTNVDLMSRMFGNDPGDRGSISGRVILKALKMVLDTSLLNTQHYKVRIKGKVE